MPDLDKLLNEADPAARWGDEVVRERVRLAAESSRKPEGAGRRPAFWRRASILVPTIILGAALTGAAVVIPLQLGLNDRAVDIDLELPVRYETASGEQVNCTYGVYFSSPSGRGAEFDAAVEKLRAEDWSTIGQEFHDYAVKHPVTPQDGAVWEDDSTQVREKIAWELATTAVMTDHVSSVLPAGAGFASTTDCSGKLS